LVKDGCTFMIRGVEIRQAAERLLGSLRSRDRLILIPADTVAGRALVTVIAIMTFLATLTGGSAVLVREASRDWTATAAREMTVQVKPTAGRNAEGDASKIAQAIRVLPGIDEARVFSREESARLLEPWLGAGLDLGELPIPVLVVIRLNGASSATLTALRERVREISPTAVLDDHRGWVQRLERMAGALVLVALIVLCLVLTAMGLAIAFATRGAMAGNREIVSVLHFVGASDRFIAREFQRHFLRLGLRGAVVGGLASIIVFLLSGWLTSRWSADPAGEQIEALFGKFQLGGGGYIVIAAIAFMMALLTGFISRNVVYRQLRRIG
jgi:cell division transport system permease protein